MQFYSVILNIYFLLTANAMLFIKLFNGYASPVSDPGSRCDNSHGGNGKRKKYLLQSQQKKEPILIQ